MEVVRILVIAGLLVLSSVQLALAAGEPTIPDGERRQHLQQLGVLAAHQRGVTGRGIRIAILDSGFRGYRDQLGKTLPARVVARSFRDDGDLEARESHHGILCAEVIHAIAPDAELYLINWEPDTPTSFLKAIQWARAQHIQVISCSIIMPGWSDGQGGGPVQESLQRLLGDGTHPGDMLCCTSAGNLAQRHWAGAFRPNRQGVHQWSDQVTLNPLSPWGVNAMSVELTTIGEMHANFEVIDTTDDQSIRQVLALPGGGRAIRFLPIQGHDYRVRVWANPGAAGKLRLVILGGYLDVTQREGSVCFPGDGRHCLTVGAVDSDGERSAYSSCGQRTGIAKPDCVATVPFPSRFRAQPFSGTSAAAPQAAGLAALWCQCHPDWTIARTRGAMQTNCRDLNLPGHDIDTGYGLLHLPSRP